MPDILGNSVALLAHFDGGSGATTFADSCNFPRTLTSIASAASSTVNAKFGASSLLLNGTSQALSLSPTLNFSSGDFTVEAWVFNDGATGGGTLLSSGTAVSAAYQFSVNKSGGTWYMGITCNSPYTDTGLITTTISSTGWHHVAFSLTGTTLKGFFDGALVLTSSLTSRPAVSGGTTFIGKDVWGGVAWFNGYIDELRVTLGTGRYSAAFTPAVAAFDTVVPYCTLNLTAPSPILTVYSGATAALSAPIGVLSSASGAYADLTGPIGVLTFAVHDATGENAFSGTAPRPVLAITTGANSSVTAPAPALTASMTITGWGTADLTNASGTLTTSMTATGSGAADLTTRVPPTLIGYSGALCSITLTDAATLVATGTTGGIGGATITCPLFDLVATATAQNHGSANLLAPAAVLGGQAQAWLLPPAATLVAVGTAVVAVSYEAYAVNLNHTPKHGVIPVDEMTRYTAYPFDRIVRYKNSYFGMNSTGLYLLEGSVDLTTPATWAVRSAETDMGSVQKKTVEMAYFGGRMAPASTINLYAGEGTVQPYSYTTPRGELAQNYRQPFGRGIKARYYAFGVTGSGTLNIDSVTFNVATLSRKV